MIRIQKIVLKNFKSFKKAEIPVSQGFTAIVGSNGSGKSNILDAFLFVFGINSLKALRASRMTDLVNNQSKDDYAKVELHLVEPDSKREFVISRTIDTHGKSVVRLNDKRVTLNEVQNLLEEFNIKPFGHNIVVQGDVTRIIEMNPVQRRELIDEVAGIREFDEKRLEAQKELEKVDVRIKEVRIVVSERASQLEQLSRDREAALRHKALVEELDKSKATLLKSEIGNLSESLKKNTEKREKLTAARSEKEAELEKMRVDLIELEKQLEDANRELLSASQKTFSEIGIRLEERKSEKRVLEERISTREKAIERILVRKSQIEKRLTEIEDEFRDKQALVGEKNTEAGVLEAQISEKQSELTGLRKELDRKNSDLKKIEQGLGELEAASDEKTRGFFEFQSELSSNIRTTEMKRRQLQEWFAERTGLLERIKILDAKKESLDNLLEKYPGLESQLKEIHSQIESALKQATTAESRLEASQKAVLELEKAAAKCPTCETDLTQKRRKELIVHKNAEIKHYSQELAKAKANRSSLLDRQKELQTAEEKCTELRIAIAPLKDLAAKSAELEEKTRRLQLETDEKKRLELEQKLEALRSEMEESQSQVDGKKAEIARFRSEIGFDKMQKMSDELTELNKKLGIISGLRKELELQTSLILVEEKESSQKELGRIESEQKDLRALIEKESAQTKALDTEVAKLNLSWVKAEQQSREIEEKKNRIGQKQIQLREKTEKEAISIRDVERRLNEIEVENGKLEVRLADVSDEFKQFLEFPTFESFDLVSLRKRIPEIEREISRLGAINQKALENFGEYEKEMLEIKRKADRLEEERLAVLDMIQKIEDRRTQVFMDCFEQINANFREMHFLLGEGVGRLELENPEKPLESGLLIEASLKGKDIYNIDAMSGGEKTLTALAFLFAIQVYDKAPFYVFDEADAALDKENSAKLGRIIAKVSGQFQFIGITHNDTIVKQANQIIGVALNEQKSSVVGLRLREQVEAQTS